ncbi:hypothetical protein [Pelagibacterium sp. H642]|uniref:hypothetical protein n=1 Tax=Pelagibacterium sp. H642 TaxID=1881069 RepID=UPI0028155671|nr:hypothetical protein [Pelagibacterium sp. H642]WMT92633.1 hypothetical protein NO934_20020 [Pelagibacterium sp. H642]
MSERKDRTGNHLNHGKAQTPEETRKATQENQEANRPSRPAESQEGQKDYVNDSSNPRYALSDTEKNKLSEDEVENEPKERIDHL